MMSDRIEDGILPDPADPRALRDALGRFATGVTLVTACDQDAGTPIGIVVNSFASVSLDPPLVLWSVARSSMRHRHFAAAQAFSIHVLSADQRSVTERFSRSGPGFDGLAHRLDAAGVPLVADVLARFDCVTETVHDGGDHSIIIGRVSRFALGAPAEPLCFFGGGFGGFSPAA